METTIVNLEEITLLTMKAESCPEDVPATFAKLEQALGSFKGYEVYGLSRCVGDHVDYWAGVAAKDGADLPRLEKVTIPAAKYLCYTLHNWQSRLGEMTAIFSELMKQPETTKQGICLEYYRTETEADLMVQID